jgi:hypothetical protein
MSEQRNPYMTATPVPRATAPFNGIGVLADTQASITHAQDAINTYGYNLDAERDRAQQRVIKDTFYPYAVRQTDIMGKAGVLGAQGDQMQAGNRALYMGVPLDEFDPITGQQGINKDQAGNPLYGGILAPTVANPTVAPSEMQAFSARAFGTPYQMPPDARAQGQLAPLPGAAAAPTAVSPSTPYTGPLSNTPLNIPGIPSSVLGVTRAPQQPRPMATDEDRRAFDTNQGIFRDRIKQLDIEIAAADAASPVSPYGLSRGLTDPRAENLRRQRADLVKEAAAMQSPGPVGPPIVGGAESNYGIPTGSGYPAATGQGILRYPQGAPGADPLPTVPANATSYQAPPTMPPQLVPAFNQAATLYTEHAPGGPGGTEAALLFSGLESTFSPVARAGGSRAAGLTQFTPDTWMRVAKQLPWAKGRTDDEIAALRASPAHQAQAERQLRMLNYAAATAKFPGQFDPANPLNLYAMHHFGEDTGGKIAAALRKSPNTPLPTIIGPKAWASALAANPYLARKGIPLTAAQLYSNWINRAKTLGFYGGVQA